MRRGRRLWLAPDRVLPCGPAVPFASSGKRRATGGRMPPLLRFVPHPHQPQLVVSIAGRRVEVGSGAEADEELAGGEFDEVGVAGVGGGVDDGLVGPGAAVVVAEDEHGAGAAEGHGEEAVAEDGQAGIGAFDTGSLGFGPGSAFVVADGPHDGVVLAVNVFLVAGAEDGEPLAVG